MGYSEEYFILVQLGAREAKGKRKRITYKAAGFGPREKKERFGIIKLKLKQDFWA